MRSRRYYELQGQERRSPDGEPRLGVASLLLLGLIIGLGGALFYAWILDPVVYTEASPARLNAEFKEEYILLVSQSYTADGNWRKAQRRLEVLDDPDIGQSVADQLEEYLRQGKPAPVMGNLAGLAARLDVNHPAVAVFVPELASVTPGASAPEAVAVPGEATPTLAAPPSPTPTRHLTPAPSPTPSPTSRPSATAMPIYRLLSQEQLCQRDVPVPRIEVVVLDASLEPLPGVEVLVQWDGGSDHLYTGFQPEHGLGYGDFTMSPDTSYSVVLAEGSPLISGLRLEACEQRLGGLTGGWRLTFQHTRLARATTVPES